MTGISSFLRDLLSWLVTYSQGSFLKYRLRRHLRRPKETQRDLLLQIIKRNKDTEFGGSLRFNEIRGVKDYQKQIGFFSYERLHRYLRRQISQSSWITVSGNVSHELRFVDRTGRVKSVPCSADDVKRISRDMQIYYAELSRLIRPFDNRVLNLFGPHIYSATEINEKSVDTTIGRVFRSQPEHIGGKNVLPEELRRVRSFQQRNFVSALLALNQPKISSVLTANPITLLNLYLTIERHFDELCQTIETGNLPNRLEEVSRLNIGLEANPDRAKQLKDIKSSKSNISLVDIWPHLKAIVCWTRGSFKSTVRQLRRHLPNGFPILEMGEIGPSYIGTLNLDMTQNTCAPALNRVFYEFTERKSWEAGFSRFRLLHELQIGEEYYVFVTTQSGLYRYETNDIVRVTKKILNTPAWELISHDGSHTNLKGEQLSETHVIDTIEYLNTKHDCAIDHYLLLADKEDGNYDLYVESDQQFNLESVKNWFDSSLGEFNPAWTMRRRLSQLSKPTITPIPKGTLLSFRAEMLPDYNFDSQFDLPVLQYRDECRLTLPKPVRS